MVAINLSDAFHMIAINGHQVVPDALYWSIQLQWAK
jgi:hypothetical protein